MSFVGRIGLCGIAVWCVLANTASPMLSMTSAEDNVLRIAVGSCVRQGEPQPIWTAIVRQKPDLFLFMGDTVYADTTDPDELRRQLAKLGAQNEFKALCRTCPVYAVWDDHDYGINDGGAEHPTKREMQKVFQDFFGIPEDSPARKQEGVQQAFVIGEAGRRVQIVMLDTRYHRGPLKAITVAGNSLYVPNPDPAVSMLGSTQWAWFEKQVTEVPAEVRIIVSSIQVIPDDHPFEKWANLPRERSRLLEKLGTVDGSVVLALSGDQHLAEISRIQLDSKKFLYELTSSGMTHTREGIPAPNRFRLGEAFVKKNFGIVEVAWEDKQCPVIALCIYDERGELIHREPLQLTGAAAPSK